jgi:hypothetical protein
VAPEMSPVTVFDRHRVVRSDTLGVRGDVARV